MRSLRFFVNVLWLLALKYTHGVVAIDVVSATTAQTTVAFQPTPVVQGCGGNLNGAGNITTPGYPSFFPPLASCSWSLTVANGSAIQLDFLDFALDKGNSYLYIWDSSRYQSFSLTGSDSNMTSMRLGNQISLYFSSNSYLTNRGFSLRFKAVAIANMTNSSLFYSSTLFTSCGSNLTNQGNFSSPNYPASYPNSAYCLWQLTASPGKVLQLFCLSFETENNYDFVYVTSEAYNKSTPTFNWLTGNSSNCSMNLGSSANVIFSSDSTVTRKGFTFGFRSIPPPGVNDPKFTSCGGRLNGSGVITSPNYPGSYPSNAFCVWYITAQGGDQLRFSTISYNVEASNDYVKIYDSPQINATATIYDVGSSLVYLLGIFVGGLLQTGPSAVVVFSSDGSIEQSGFYMTFSSETNSSAATPVTSNPLNYISCGSNLTGEGNITSPNYPEAYPNNAICKWSVSASPGKVLQLFCRSFNLENNYDYLYVSSQVGNKTSTDRLSGSSSNCSWILGSTVSVTFTSDLSIQYPGFVLGFRSVTPPTVNRTEFKACGGKLNGSGVITSPNYPGSYPSNAFCAWYITAQGGNQLRFSTNFYDVEAPYDYVKIYNSPQINESATIYDVGSSSYYLLGMYFGGYIQTGSSAVVVFSSDGSIEKSGFSLNFWSDSNYIANGSTSYAFSTPSIITNMTTSTPHYPVCGGNLYKEGNITTPGYPNTFPPYTSCSWTITAANGSGILLEFIDFALDKQYSYLYIWDQVFYNSFSLSGTESNMTSLRFSSQISVYFSSYSFATSRGFSLRFKSVAFQNSTNASSSYISNMFTGCGSNLTNQGNLTSPNYPAQYPNNAYCTWNITAAPGKVLQLFCLSFDLENNYDSIFVSSQVNNKTTVIYNWLSGNSSNCSWNLGAKATVVFNSDATVRRQGFVLGYRSVVPQSPVNRTTFTQCGGNITGSGTVSSPNYPGSYPSNSRCVWRLRAFSGQVLRLYFNSHDLEDQYDTVVIYNSEDITMGSAMNYSSYWQQNMYWTQFNSEVVVVFTSDDSVERQGFQLYFTSEYSSGYSSTTATTPSGCGGYYFGEGNITTPGYPNNFPQYSWCSWTLTAANGSAILLEFLDFALEKQYSYLYIWDNIFYYSYFLSGTDNSLAPLRFSNQIGLYFYNYNYGTSRGFNIRFKSVASTNTTNASSLYYSNIFTSCGSNISNQGNITSPNYPAQYPNNANCVWNISASPGKVIQLFCLSFDVENNYDSVYVTSQVYNKTTSTYNWLSGNSSNCSMILGPSATISFTSDATVRRPGFVIGFRSVAPPSYFNRSTFTECGGNLTSSGYLSSPNYPSSYPSNSKCIWRLRASDGQVLRLYFYSYDLEDVYDSVIIYNSENMLQGTAMNYTSYLQQNMYYAQFNSEVVVVFTSDNSVERQGFQISFTSEYPYWGYSTTTTAPPVGCGGYLYGEGNITTPGYPNNFPIYSSCSWTITATNGSAILLEFLDFALDKQYSYLYIWDRVLQYGYSLSGTDSNVSSLLLSNQVGLYFNSYNYGTSRGFSIRFKSVTSRNTTNSSVSYFSNAFTSCGSKLTNQGNLTSPNYPAQYPNNANCVWNITASPGKVLQLFCLSFDLENNYDYVYVTSQVYNKTTYTYNWLSGNSSNCSMNLGSSATISFTSDATVRRQGFMIGFRSVMPVTVFNRTTYRECGGNLSGSGYISSPNYPSSYPSNSKCTWRVRASDGQVLRLYFYSYDIEDTYDSLIIYNSGNMSQESAINYTSYWQQSMYWTQFNSEVVVLFTSDENVERSGIQIYFTSEYPYSGYSTTTAPPSVDCGGDINNEGNISSPSYPQQYPGSTWCWWTIATGNGSTLVIEFVDLDTVKGSDYLTIYTNGSSASYGGNELPRPIRGGSYAYIQFGSSSLTNGSISRRGFKIRIYSINLNASNSNLANAESINEYYTACGGNFTGKGNLTSPGYPALYPNKATCSYSLSAQSASDNIVLKFTTFGTEESFDYLYIFGLSYNYYVSYQWLTGSTLPSTVVLPSKAILWFSSDTTVRGRGFFATFLSVPANSTFSSEAVTKYSMAISSTSMTSVITSKPSTILSTTQKTTTTTASTTVITTKSTTKLTPSTTSAPSQTCGGVLYSAGVFSSPNYPAKYPINAICNWTLVASPGRVVLINFQNFALESGADYLRIYNGTEISWKTPFISYTGFSVPQQQLLTEIVSVVFMSDDLITFKGFKANFTSVPSRGPNNTTYSSTATPSVCGGILQSSGEIMSPNFPYAYPNDVSCVWTFSVKSGGAYRFEFLNFTTEEFWDYVVIRTGAVETTRVSGSKIPAIVVIVSNGSISFTSDESVQNSGFRIRYSRLTSVTTSRTTVKPTTSSLGVCGVAVTDLKAQKARISGGYDAPAASAPWHVQISRGSTNFGGVLLNSRWVLTAASNLKYAQASTYNLVFGKQRLNVQNVGQLSASAISILKYPGYNETTGDGDIALIKIGTSVSFTTKIRPICLPTDTVQAGQVCYATGYGNDGVGALKVARVTIIERQSCVNYVTLFSKNQICGGYIGGGEDVCQGDTGGPLVYFKNGRYELQAITSQASCGKPFSPSIFTAVAPSISWINSVAF